MGLPEGIRKSPTGIEGFDDLTLGGLPTGRPSLVCGTAGCGKTQFASTFLIHGAREFDEPGVFVTFEERPVDIVNNVASLGFAVNDLIASGKIHIEHIAIDPSEVAEIGDYERICAEHLAGQYVVDVIDLKEAPHLAREHNIVAIPTLVRQLPVPIRKIIGDLSDTQKVLVNLSVGQ